MRTKFLLAVCFLGLSAFAAKAEYVRGTINGWTTAHSMAQDTSFGSIWKVTITATNTVSAGGLLFDQNGDYNSKWAKGTNASLNTTVGNAENGGATDLDMGFTNGNRYSFLLAGSAADFNRAYVVMETAADPVTIPAVSDTVSQSTGAVPVVIQLSAAPSASEKIWVRFTTNSSFASSLLVPASGSSTNYTVSLPAQTAGARAYYYVLTSTMPSNVITGSFDLCTLRGKTAGATNYSFRFGPMNAWHFPTNAEPSGAFMRNPPTNGVPTNTVVYFYSGVQTGGTGNACNQSGMAILHRLKGAGTWATNGGSYDNGSSTAENAFWIGNIPANTYGATNEVEYIVRVSATDHNTTYIGSTNGLGNVLFLDEAQAKAQPFTFTYGGPVINVGNCWHIPSNSEPPGVTMRNPLGEPQTNQAVYVYNGNQALGTGNPGDQSGGRLVYRLAPAGAWQTNALVFDVESGNNKYWRGEIPASTFGATNEVEYYLAITYTDHDTTFLGTPDNQTSAVYGVESSAQSNLFAYTYSAQAGQSAAYLWHADNRVVLSGSNVQFWVKIGYAQGTGTNRYVDFAKLYYTIDGSAPGGAKGVATNAGTQVASLDFDHMEEDSYEGGDSMWWVGTVSNLPMLTTIRYTIGAYKTTNDLERFADYGTSGTNHQNFSFALGASGSQSLTVNGQSADYTATKFFIDEIAGETQSVAVIYSPGVANVTNAEVFSNLDRRDLADVDYTNALISADGYPDGIKPPEGNLLTVADTGAYFRAWTMSGGSGTYGWTGTVSKTGAYRLTARFQTNGSPTWTWYSGGGRRDHAVVASPEKALDMTLYELNTLTVEATAPSEGGRSTFRDLLSTANPAGDDDAFDPFNLEYLNFIQANALWFQPIHPVGYDRAENDALTSAPYAPGSPYATKNYWAVTPAMGAGNTEGSALAEFTNFVAQCDTYTGSVGRINVMLDGVFNHSSWDAVMGQGGVDLGFTVDPNARIGSVRPGWYAKLTDYGDSATTYSTAWDNDFATAPDRGDFGKWNDVTEFYFGKYSALVRHNPDNNGDYLNEDDAYDFAGMTTNTMDLWKYFAYYPEYWLKKTGHTGTNQWDIAQDDKGIDSLRCDFGQGLPPQLWEYIINRTRKMKWNFVFMAETLDGGKPGYRSNRHFDLLNENLVFQFTQSKISDSSTLSYAFYQRGQSYAGGAILLNITSHDEVMADNDPWLCASRYAAVSCMAGLPMVFYGQEKGIGLHDPAQPWLARDGFAEHELNFGKYVPHFKRWNQLTVWTNTPPDSGGLDQWYGRVNWARLNSPALRSRNYQTLGTTGGPEDTGIFAVAKWENYGAGPATSDVVLAFTRFMEHGGGHSLDANTFSLQPVWGALGLDTSKSYTVRNLASSDAFAEFTSGWPKTGTDLYNNGIYVSLPVDTAGSITNDGSIVQYLKLVEMPAETNSAPVISLPALHILALGSTTSFAVTVSDANGNAVTTNFAGGPAGSTFSGGLFSWTATPTNFVNTTNLVVFTADDQQGATNSVVTNRATIVVPFDFDADGLGDDWEIANYAVLTNGAAGDTDGDHVPNADEYVAGTAPTNGSSYFRVQAVSNASSRAITVPTVAGRRYQVFYANGNYSNQAGWTAFGNTNDGYGTWLETNSAGGTRTFVDDESANSTFGPPAGGQRSYRVDVVKP